MEYSDETEFGDLFRFEKFVTPKVITFIYWIGLLVIGISAVAKVFGGSLTSLLYSSFSRYGAYYVQNTFDTANVALSNVIWGLVYGTIMVLVWRVVCEIWVVIFSINDRLGMLVNRGGGQDFRS